MFPCVVPRCRRRGLVFLPHEFEAHAMRRLLAHHHLAVRQAAESLKLYDWAMKKYRELTCYNGLVVMAIMTMDIDIVYIIYIYVDIIGLNRLNIY